MTFTEPAPITEIPIDAMPDDPFLWSTDIPKPDTPFTYTGAGPEPSWKDVYDATERAFTDATPTHGDETADPFFKYAQTVGRAAVGETLKATASFINRAYEDTLRSINLLDDVTDYRFTDVVGRINNVIRRVNGISHTLAALTGYVLPLIRAEFDKIEHDTPIMIEYGLALERDWTLHHVFAPLYAEILKVQPAIDSSARVVTQLAHDNTQTQVAALAAAVGVTVAGIRTRLATLEAESANCTQPMCETMGPKTDLGKLLKGLNLALEAAALAELLGATEDDLAQLFADVARQAGRYLDFFETNFVAGGQTIGHTITSAIGGAL